MLGSRKAGILLYVAQIVALLITGILYARIFNNNCHSARQSLAQHIDKATSLASLFTEAIRSSTLGVIIICGFVTFFSVLCGIVTDVGARLSLPDSIPLVLCSLLEMSCGCLEVTRALPTQLSLYACAIILGFSGVSVHFQILSLCNDVKIEYGKFFLVKLLTGTLSGIVTIILNLIFKIFV